MAAQQESADAKRVALELRAGKAVAAGALLAGPLAKRSSQSEANGVVCRTTTTSGTATSRSARKLVASTPTKQSPGAASARAWARRGACTLRTRMNNNE